MGQHRQTTEEVQQNLGELLDWQFAERNDQAVAQALQSGQGVDMVYGLEEAGLLDGFFAFLTASGIKAHWQTLTIAGVRHLFVPVLMFVLLYGTRVLFGIASSNALPALLFSNVAAMTLIGFNAHQVAAGLSTRGAKLRTAASEYTLMDPQTLANAICKISASALQDLFNGTIQALAAFGVFMAEVMVAVDGTRVVTAPTFQGCGKLSVTERQRNRQGVQVEIVKFLFGWRLIALLDLRTLIPLALKIVPIQAHEAPYLVALVQQAQANLAPHSRISQLVIDRAYVDGASLYALHELGITFRGDCQVEHGSTCGRLGRAGRDARSMSAAKRCAAGTGGRPPPRCGSRACGWWRTCGTGTLFGHRSRSGSPCAGRSAPSCTR